MKSKFPLLGKSTAVYAALFWTDRFPQYMHWGYEMLERIQGAADLFLLVSDGKLKKSPPGFVTEVTVNPRSDHDKLGDYFRTAVGALADRDVGAFYYLGIDNMYDVPGVAGMLNTAMTDADVVFTDLAYSADREDMRRFPIDPDRLYSRTHGDCYKFSVDVHSWSDGSCYRTSMFTEYPIADEPREFIRFALKRAADDGCHPHAVYKPEYPFYYYQHDRNPLDRSFIQPEEVYAESH